MTNLETAVHDAPPVQESRPWVGEIFRRPIAVMSIGWLLLVAVVALAAPILAPYDPTETDLSAMLSGPTTAHLLGTDALGRDILSRLIYGGQLSLIGVVEAVAIAVLVGVPGGLAAGYLRGWTDRAASWVVDIVLAIPSMVTLLMVVAVFGASQTPAMIALGILGAPQMFRVVRSVAMSVRSELYVSAAKVGGLPTHQILLKHVLPASMGPLVVQVSIFAGVVLLVQTGLDYLGLGAQPPAPSWGGEVSEASRVIAQQPWLLVPSGIVIGFTILAFGLMGDVVGDVGRSRRLRPSATSARKLGVVQPPQADAPARAPSSLLAVRDLSVAVPLNGGLLVVSERVDLDIRAGETVGLVGESGCGKSVTGKAILGLPSGGQVIAGSIRFDGVELTDLSQAAMRSIRGSKIAMISQEPLAALDPAFTVGFQLDELVRMHQPGSRRMVRARTLELLRFVRLPDPEAVARKFVHELSGGMAQRVAIAQALSGGPKLLIADEPTTALDVTVQAEILELLRDLQRETGMAILLITHNWGVVADICARAYVMYAGHIVETADADSIFRHPLHPYSRGLLNSTPHRGVPKQRLSSIAGSVPPPSEWPTGCHFAPRCELRMKECTSAPIPMLEPEPNHHTRCIRLRARTSEGAVA